MVLHRKPIGGFNKMKLVWVCYSRMLESVEHLSGSERIERLRHLAADGIEVHLIAGQFNEKHYSSCVSANLHLVSIPIKYLPMFSTIIYGLTLFFFLPFYLIRVRPDVVICDQSPSIFLIWKPILSKLLNFKLIIDVRSTPVTSGTRVKIVFHSSMWVAKTLFDGMTVVTPLMRDEICHTFNIDPNWTGILSNGISEEFISTEEIIDRGRILREQLGLTNKFVILYHGSFRLTGGLIESIKAIALVKDKHPDAVLFLLGSSDRQLLDLLRQTIKENKVEENVFLHGPVGFLKVPEFIAMSNLGLVPLPNIPFWRYQQPLKLLEYLAMNKTVIISESPAHRIVVSNNKNAIYVPQVTPTEIAKAIEYAYNNKEKLDEWGRIGRDIVIKKYVWKKVNEDFTAYLQTVRLSKNGYATPKKRQNYRACISKF